MTAVGMAPLVSREPGADQPGSTQPVAGRPAMQRPASGTRARGAATLRFRCRDGATVLDDLYHSAPLRVLLPRPPTGDLTMAVVATTSGGLVGGDSIALSVDLEAGARAMVLPQAAEKVYGQAREDVTWRTTLQAKEGAWLEAVPMATILFDGARLRRHTTVALSAGAESMTGDMLIFGRQAHGEDFRVGRLDDRWEIARDGRLLWADRLDLGDDPAAALAHPAGLDGARALGSLIYVGPSADALLDLARGFEAESDAQETVRFGATCLGETLIVRLLSTEPWALRKTYEALWCRARALAAGLPERLPAVWYC